VLDLHFHPVFASILGVVTSTGAISIYNLAEELVSSSHGDVGDSPLIYTLKHRVTHQVFPSSTIITSFAWYRATGESNFKQPSSDLMACTTSDNSVYLVRLNWVVDHADCPDSEQEIHYTFNILNDGQPINKHDLEAWCCAFSLEGTVYSGGDDGKIRATPLYQDPFNKAKDVGPQEVARQTVFSGHGAGVTAILVLPLSSSPLGCILLTGSYDDYVRVYAEYDFRPYVANTKPKALAELKIGGGVWRLKFLQDYPTSMESGVNVKYRVLASCMHEGARILEVSGNQMGEWKIEVLASMKIHESMCYAADVRPLAMNPPYGWDETRLCVSTSFYDKLLCAWTFNPNTEADTPIDETELEGIN
jgi:diphthine methyl ester acylhydrolase